MSEVNETPATPVTPAVAPAPAPAAAPVPAVAAPAKPLNAIQLIEQELVAYIRQREQQIANLHAIEGAIQGAQKLLGKLKAEAVKAVAEVEKVAGEVETEVVKEAGNVVQFVKKEVEKL
jgi:3-oxoacyl-ACP reductase-like protein